MNAKQYLKNYIKPHIGRILVIVISVTIAGVLALLSPLVFSVIIDNLLKLLPITNQFTQKIIDLFGGVQYLRNNLWIGFIVIIVISIFAALLNFIKGKNNSVVGESIAEKMRNDLYEHLQYLPYSFHQQNKTGELIQKCTSDVDVIRRFLGSQISEITNSIITTAVALVILFNINSKLALIGVISMPLNIVIAFWFFQSMQKVFLASDESEGELLNVIQENLQGTRVVKAFNKEKLQFERFDKHIDNFNEKTFKVIKLLGWYWSMTDVLCLAQILAIIYFGIVFANNGLISTGDFFVFLSYEAMILWPIRMLGRIIADMGKMFVSAGRLAEIINREAEDLSSGTSPDLSGDIVFRDVYFKFDDGDTHALKGINLTIEANKTTAIMGPIGSGKSTLVHLLCRLYDYESGEITINNIPLNDIAKGYLRKNIGIVLQEPFLFSRTIEDNIKIAVPDAESKTIVTAAKIASVHDVISSFDRGYETMVGERGVTLSGGQKQRISIARVIINDVKILIFDDSLSAVDSETDSQIRGALRELSAGMTTIIITHRCDSAFSADKIVVLEKGQITQSGTHKQLMKESGFYQRIYNLQKLQGGK